MSGIARALADENPPAARTSAARALEIDMSNVGAHLFIAEQELGDRNTDAARESLDRALEINPASLEARALRAAMAYLDDRVDDFQMEVARALTVNPAYGDIYRVAGSHTARAYRFDEAAALVRRALELDPTNSRAHAELGMHLLRTGDEPGAREALEHAFADDPFDVITFNLLGMMDTLGEFETFQRGDVIVRVHPDEAPVLKEYVLSLAQEALDALSASYNMEVEGPILVEVFPRHDDFAVRNLGLPGMIGALGACFGRVVTMDSPRARPPGDFNWRATLWHEMAHVITLQMSAQRVPRWLTEGISVYEERRARPAWGRDQEMTFARALNEDSVLALSELNAGFSRPDTISLAYFQASVLVEHIVDAYGEAALHELVRSYGDGLDNRRRHGADRSGLRFVANHVRPGRRDAVWRSSASAAAAGRGPPPTRMRPIGSAPSAAWPTRTPGGSRFSSPLGRRFTRLASSMPRSRRWSARPRLPRWPPGSRARAGCWPGLRRNRATGSGRCANSSCCSLTTTRRSRPHVSWRPWRRKPVTTRGWRSPTIG